MKVLVTGSSGFIGRHVVAELLSRGLDVVGLDVVIPKEKGEGECFVRQDLLDRRGLTKVFAEHLPDAVIHLAARTSMKKVSAGDQRFAVNTDGQLNLMSAIGTVGTVKRAIYTSTKYVFRGGPPVPDREYRPETSYGESKAAMEEMIWENDGGGCEWFIVRPTTIWGPGMGRHYQLFLKMVVTRRYVNLGNVGSLKHMGYVQNVAYQFAEMLSVPMESIGRVFYVGDYEALNLHEWVDAFSDEFGTKRVRRMPLSLARLAGSVGDLIVRCGLKKFPFTNFRVTNLVTDDLCEMEPTRKICGTLPISQVEAVKRTVEWYRSLDEAAGGRR